MPNPTVLQLTTSDPRLVSIRDLRFDYDEVVLKSVDLELRGGRCLGLVGLNASGKTTLARLLRGQLRPKAGLIQLGDPVARASPRKGLIGGGLSFEVVGG